MLKLLGFSRLDDFVDAVVPQDIRRKEMRLPAPLSEREALAALQKIANKNQVFRSLIGQGYYGTVVPPVILRNVLENPAWYTSYTPYQPEISQGRLEALLNFQTMVCDLTGMEIANASLLDEATAAAEAMMLARRQSKAKPNVFLVDQRVHPQTIDVLLTRAGYQDIEIAVGGLIHQTIQLGNIGELHLVHPTLRFCGRIKQIWLIDQRLIDLNHLTGHRTFHLAGGLHRLNHRGLITDCDLTANLRQLDKNNIAQRILGKIRNPDSANRTLDTNPLMIISKLQHKNTS